MIPASGLMAARSACRAAMSNFLTQQVNIFYPNTLIKYAHTRILVRFGIHGIIGQMYAFSVVHLQESSGGSFKES